MLLNFAKNWSNLTRRSPLLCPPVSSSQGNRLVARDWDPSDGMESRSEAWFAFCHDDSDRVVDEIGHMGVGMTLCQADHTYRKAVFDRSTG